MKAGTKVRVTLGMHKGEWKVAAQKGGKKGREAGMIPIKIKDEVVLLPLAIVEEIKN